jgi:hypothetical protein
METNRSSTSRFTKNSNLLRITSKSLDILLHPMKCQPLIFKTDIQQTFLRKLVRARESPKTKTIIDRDADDRLAKLDRLFNDK